MSTSKKRSTPDRLHSVQSAAEFLGGVAPSTIRAWLTQGKLHRVKIGRLTRVRESELLALIKLENKQEIRTAKHRSALGAAKRTAAPLLKERTERPAKRCDELARSQ